LASAGPFTEGLVLSSLDFNAFNRVKQIASRLVVSKTGKEPSHMKGRNRYHLATTIVNIRTGTDSTNKGRWAPKILSRYKPIRTSVRMKGIESMAVAAPKTGLAAVIHKENVILKR